MPTWIVHKGIWTQKQMDQVVHNYHVNKGRVFDGRRVVRAAPMTRADRIFHEATICGVVEALEKAGFTVGCPAEEER